MSARGLLDIDVRHDMVEPLFQRASSLDEGRVRKAIASSDAHCDELRSGDASITDWRQERSVDVRYFGQISGYLNLPLGGADPIAEIADLAGRFEDEHAREFGYRLPPGLAEVEIVNLRTALIGAVEHPPELTPALVADSRLTSEIDLYSPGEGWVKGVRMERDGIGTGESVEGPAIITEWDATTVVPPGATSTVAEGGDLVISIPPKA
jgi:N-methylhydantoinase A